MSYFSSKRRVSDYSGSYVESPIGKMYLNRTKDPAQATIAISMQKRLVELISGMTDEESPDEMKEINHLLMTGVDPSVPDYNLSLYYAGKNFYSPVHYSVKKGLHKLTELLLNYKANPNALDRYSVTPIHLGADVGSEKCLKKLLEFGADVNSKTQQFRKPNRPEYTPDPVVREKYLSPEEFSFHILPYAVGSTPLHLAAKQNHIECVKLLIDHGADYNATDDSGFTSLYLAAKEGLSDCVMAQLHSAVGFPILSIPTKQSDTALHECLRHGEKMRECIKELVRRGADVSLHNYHSESAVHVAIKYKWSMDMIELLILEGYGMDFDRQKERTPLTQVVFGERRQQITASGCARQTAENHAEKLAVFFLRMGASRRNLQQFMWHELNREEAGGCLFETLLDSFDYLPPLNDLGKGMTHTENLFPRESSDDDSQGMDLDEAPRLPEAMRPNWNPFEMFDRNNAFLFDDPSYPLMENGVHQIPTINVHVRRMRNHRLRALQRRRNRWGHRFRMMDDDFEEAGVRMFLDDARLAEFRRLSQTPSPLVAEKQKQYIERCRQGPSLAHLSRSVVRKTLKADVRKVISFPIPTPLKEYILLGHQLSTCDPVHERNESVPPVDSSAESGNLESMTSSDPE